MGHLRAMRRAGGAAPHGTRRAQIGLHARRAVRIAAAGRGQHRVHVVHGAVHPRRRDAQAHHLPRRPRLPLRPSRCSRRIRRRRHSRRRRRHSCARRRLRALAEPAAQPRAGVGRGHARRGMAGDGRGRRVHSLRGAAPREERVRSAAHRAEAVGGSRRSMRSRDAQGNRSTGVGGFGDETAASGERAVLRGVLSRRVRADGLPRGGGVAREGASGTFRSGQVAERGDAPRRV